MVDLPGFDKQQLKKAVKSLLKYVGEQQESGPAQLIEEDELLHLVVALKKAPVGPRKDKPIRLPIPHPLFTAEGAEICLFVKDHKGEGHKAAKARLAKLQKNGGVHKVGVEGSWQFVCPGGGGACLKGCYIVVMLLYCTWCMLSWNTAAANEAQARKWWGGGVSLCNGPLACTPHTCPMLLIP
jgi:hypothetical protein